MNTNTQQLRLNAYSVNDAGHILCDREGRDDERTAVIRIDLAEDSKAGRDIIERLVGLIDEPRALRGTAKNGSCVLLFRCGKYNPVPSIQSDSSQAGIFKLAARDGGVRVTITCASHGQTLDVSTYTWPKGRSPLEIDRDRLPILTGDTGTAVIEAAFSFGYAWASQVEHEIADAKRMDDIRSGRVVLETDEDRQAAEDERIVAHYANHEFGQFDDMRPIVRAARRRVAERKAAAA